MVRRHGRSAAVRSAPRSGSTGLSAATGDLVDAVRGPQKSGDQSAWVAGVVQLRSPTPEVRPRRAGARIPRRRFGALAPVWSGRLDAAR
jgi:hypothetical protein